MRLQGPTQTLTIRRIEPAREAPTIISDVQEAVARYQAGNPGTKPKSASPGLQALKEGVVDRLRSASADGVPASASGGARDRLDLLRELADLRDSGVLTDDEFEAEKQRILASD